MELLQLSRARLARATASAGPAQTGSRDGQGSSCSSDPATSASSASVTSSSSALRGLRRPLSSLNPDEVSHLLSWLELDAYAAPLRAAGVAGAFLTGSDSAALVAFGMKAHHAQRLRTELLALEEHGVPLHYVSRPPSYCLGCLKCAIVLLTLGTAARGTRSTMPAAHPPLPHILTTPSSACPPRCLGQVLPAAKNAATAQEQEAARVAAVEAASAEATERAAQVANATRARAAAEDEVRLAAAAAAAAQAEAEAALAAAQAAVSLIMDRVASACCVRCVPCLHAPARTPPAVPSHPRAVAAGEHLTQHAPAARSPIHTPARAAAYKPGSPPPLTFAAALPCGAQVGAPARFAHHVRRP